MRAREVLSAFVSVLAVIVVTPTLATAQPRRFEIAVLIPIVRFANINPDVEWEKAERARRGWPPLDVHYPGWTEPGWGVRWGFYWKDNIAFDAEFNVFRTYAYGYIPALAEDLADLYGHYRGWQKIQVLFGPRLIHRFRQFDLFGKIRVGCVHFGRFPAIVFVNRISDTVVATATVDNYSATFPALDVGGGVERSLSRHFSVRADLGDTVIRYRPSPRDLNSIYFRHNLQLSFSLGWRF